MEYHKIETLFNRDDKFKVIPTELRNESYGLIKKWQFTEKIDGANIRLMWDGASVKIGGRTDNASIPTPLLEHLNSLIKVEAFKEKFGDTKAIIYGEGYGGKIQSGGYYSKEQKFIVFDVLIDGKWWLNWENTVDVAKYFGFPTVPFLGEMTLEEGIEIAKSGFNSILAKEQTGEERLAEGIVGRPIETMYDKKMSRMIIKLKTKDF